MTVDDRHHKMYRKTVAGVTHLVARMSHGKNNEIGDGLGKRMANQCCLHPAEFWQLVSCRLTEADWDALVTERCPDGRNPFTS
jgi:hypothetical protein